MLCVETILKGCLKMIVQGNNPDSLYESLKKQGLCDEDIKLAVAMIMRLKEKKNAGRKDI